MCMALMDGERKFLACGQEVAEERGPLRLVHRCLHYKGSSYDSYLTELLHLSSAKKLSAKASQLRLSLYLCLPSLPHPHKTLGHRSFATTGNLSFHPSEPYTEL